MVFLFVLLLAEIFCWLVYPGYSASKIHVLSFPADIAVLIFCLMLLICVRKRWQINHIKLFTLPFILVVPPLLSFQFPTFFIIKFFIVLFAFIGGLNDYPVNRKFAKLFLYLVLLNVVFKLLSGFRHPSPLHIFNTNEAILVILYLFLILRSQGLNVFDQLLTLIAIVGSKSRSALISFLLYKASIRRVSILLIFLFGMFILFSDIQVFRRIPLIYDDIVCLLDQCGEGSTRVNLVINTFQVFTDKIWFGLTAEYHDHLGSTWGDYYVYSPHFGPLVWMWGYGVFGSLVFMIFAIRLFQSGEKNSIVRPFIVIGMWVWLFNDFTMSYLFWFLLGHAFSIQGRVQNYKI